MVVDYGAIVRGKTTRGSDGATESGETAAHQVVDAPPKGPEWLHEIKFDGYRMMRGWIEARPGC